MLKINDGTQIKRIAGKSGDRAPLSGVKRDRSVYVAVGGETSVDLSKLSPAIAYLPGLNQLTVRRSTKGGLISGLDYFEPSTSTITFPAALTAGEWVEIIKEVQVTGLVGLNPRPDMYTATGLAGQTLVTADFSWPYNMFPTKGQGACQVYLNGILQTRGADYTEVNLNQANTNQIVFADALAGDENIIIRPSYQVIDQSAATSLFQGSQLSQMQSMVSAGMQGFVETSSKIAVPYTYINNRASIPDPTKDLRVSFGTERIEIQAVYNIQNEFGMNGEPVFGALNDDRGIIRFVGPGWYSYNYIWGQMAIGSTNDYVEITFYGTGLNLLTTASDYARDIRASIDNSLEGSNIYNQSSTILGGRSYSVNSVCPVASGLALGVHTARIRLASAGHNFPVHGFEIINESATGNLTVNSGAAYLSGQKYTNSLAGSLAFNQSVSGTKGGRAVVYIKQDGTISQAFTPTDTSAAYFSSASHTNEEVARTYYPREFGAGRSDDFSKTPQVGYASLGSVLSFTLDDGVTTLTASSGDFVSGLAKEAIACRVNGGTQYITFVFIGTGLDVELLTDATNRQFDSITVDGTTISTSITKTGSSSADIRKIVSGLPYGTHTVKFNLSGVQSSPAIAKFIVYQPKKPTIPANAIELAEYNVMANYSASSAIQAFSPGVMGKSPMRELAYLGGTQTTSIDASEMFGWRMNLVNQSTDGFQYTFFGTGVELYLQSNGAGISGQVYIDGVLYTGSASVAGSSSCTWTPGTSTIAWSAVATNTLSISGLTLGVHTVKLLKTNSGGNLLVEGLGVITPVHSYKRSLPADIQSSLGIGSNSLTDLRNTSMIKNLPAPQKAWSQAISTASTSASTTSSSYVPMPEMSLTMKTDGGPIEIFYSCVSSNSTSGSAIFASVYVDGQIVSTDRVSEYNSYNAGVWTTISDSIIVPVSAGFHKIDVYWKASNGTAFVRNNNRILKAREI